MVFKQKTPLFFLPQLSRISINLTKNFNKCWLKKKHQFEIFEQNLAIKKTLIANRDVTVTSWNEI